MRVCKIVLISLITVAITFIIASNFIFYIPSVNGNGVEWLTYAFSLFISIIMGLISAIVSDKLITKQNKSDLEQKLHELKSMVDSGVITNEEYEVKRKELISKY